MLIQSPAILDVELGKAAIVGINTFNDIDFDNFSIVDLIHEIYKNLSASKRAKKAIRSLPYSDQHSSFIVPLFDTTYDIKNEQLKIELRLGFINLNGLHFQQKTIFIHDLKTNKTSFEKREDQLIIKQYLNSVPHVMHVRHITDFIMKELDISVSDIRHFATSSSLPETLDEAWFNGIFFNSTSGSNTITPVMILEVDVSKALKVFGDENYIAVALKNHFVFDGIELTTKQKNHLASRFKCFFKSATFTFDPKKVVDGKIVIFVSLPLDPFNRARRQRFTFVKHAANNRGQNRYYYNEVMINSLFRKRQAALVYELVKIKKFINFNETILG